MNQSDIKAKVKQFVDELPNVIGHMVDLKQGRVIVYLKDLTPVGYWLQDILKR